MLSANNWHQLFMDLSHFTSLNIELKPAGHKTQTTTFSNSPQGRKLVNSLPYNPDFNALGKEAF